MEEARASLTNTLEKTRDAKKLLDEGQRLCQEMLDDRLGKKQCVWIVRYGLTEFPLVENQGPFDSDIDPTEGILHATSIAQRLASAPSPPQLIYASPFVRTTHTAHIIASQVSSKTPVRIETGLTEWLTPSLLVEPDGKKTEPQTAVQLSKRFSSIDVSYNSVNPVVSDDDCTDVPPGAPHFVETEPALLKRCETTLTRVLDQVGDESIAIVSHAPCDQAMALFLEGAPSLKDSKLGPWPLGGITMFSRDSKEDSWKLELYGDTSHMPGKYQPGIKEWSLPCLTSSS